MSATNTILKFLDSLGAKVNYPNEDKKGEGEESKSQADPVEPKDFFWDQFIKYISSAILALTLLNITAQLFGDNGVSCFHPSDTISLLPSVSIKDDLTVYEIARGQAIFLNSYCVGSIPVTEYFPIYILIHGLLLLAPHYIWNSIFKGDFDSFFSIAGRIDRLRSSKTGEYSEENFDRVTKLEKEYGGEHKRIFYSYVLKLVSQLLVCLVSIGISAGWLKDFTYSFNCPQSLEHGVIPDEWPLNVTIPCVYTSLRILRVARVADFVLTGLAAALTLYGLVWCGVRHTPQLGHLQAAKFSFQSGLKPETFPAPPVFHFKSDKYLGIIRKHYDANCLVRGLFWLFARHKFHFRPWNVLYPRISNDLDLLLLLFFKADASHGKVFRNIQIDQELRHLIGRDQKLLHLYIDIQRNLKPEEIPTLKMLERELENEKQDTGTEKRVEEEEEKDGEERNRSCFCCCRRRRAANVLGHIVLSESATDQYAVKEHTSSRQREISSSSGELRQRHIALDPMVKEVLDLAEREGDEERPPCCTKFLLSCFGRFLTKKKGVLKKRGPKRHSSSPRKKSRDRKFTDFHDIFWLSDATVNPDTLAFFYFKQFSGNVPFKDEDLHGIRDVMYYLIRFYGKREQNLSEMQNNVVMDISFGSIGYGLIVARAFKQVHAVNFHPFFRGSQDKVTEFNKYYTNIISYLYPDDFYTYNSQKITDGNDKLFDSLSKNMRREPIKPNLPIDMIIVGPVLEETQIITINLFLNTICSIGFVRKDARLLAIRPLRIGSTEVHCHKFEPSSKMFERYRKNESHHSIEHRWVDGCRGIKIPCAGIPCVFEFTVFRCKQHIAYQPPAPTVSGPPRAFPLATPAKNIATASTIDGSARVAGIPPVNTSFKDVATSTSDDQDQVQDAGDTTGADTSNFDASRSQSLPEDIVKLAYGKATVSGSKVQCSFQRETTEV